MFATDSKHHVKSCNLLSRCHCLIPACISCFMTEATYYYYHPRAIIIHNIVSQVSVYVNNDTFRKEHPNEQRE